MIRTKLIKMALASLLLIQITAVSNAWAEEGVSESTAATEPTTEEAAQPMGPAFSEPKTSTGASSPAAPIGPGIQADIDTGESQPDLSKVNIEGDIRNLDVTNPIVPVLEKYSYDQMVQDIQTLSNTYGDLLTVNTIGTSLDGREMFELIVGNKNASRHILIQAGIHAREYMTPLLVMKQAELALSTYYRGSYNGRAIAEMFDQAAIHFVPMSNPDGTSISQFGLNGLRSEELKQVVLSCYETDKSQGRTSSGLESYLSKWKANARGVDLNYSFDAGWAEIPIHTQYPSYAAFRGTQPASEPETQALMALASQRTWAATISYHSMGQLIFWDYKVNHQRDSSRHLGNLISAATGYRMTTSVPGGGFKDWMQSNPSNTAPSVTLEVGTSPCPLPLSEYPAAWAQNKSVWAVALEFALS